MMAEEQTMRKLMDVRCNIKHSTDGPFTVNTESSATEWMVHRHRDGDRKSMCSDFNALVFC